jgi:YlmC/YmxH family sporulation protein
MFMHLSDLQGKDIVNVNDGTKIGSIIDVIIDNNGSIVSMIVQGNKFFSNLFSSKNDVEIKWEQIKKIGEDVILVNIVNYEIK